MRENKKFMISILGVIALYIVTITTTAGITRDIGKNNTNIMVEQDINKQATDVNVVEKQEEQVLPLKEIKIPEKAPKKIFAYTINIKTPIYAEPDGKIQKDSLKKAVKVEVLEEKTYPFQVNQDNPKIFFIENQRIIMQETGVSQSLCKPSN